MTIDQMRNYIAQHPKYKNSPNWVRRVMQMPDPQVFAIYKQFRKADYKQIQKEIDSQNKDNEQFHQMTLLEWSRKDNYVD